MPRLRQCVECTKCQTRYVLSLSPYENGACIISTGIGDSEQFLLYCTCTTPASIIRLPWRELKTYSVSATAFERGYGPPEQIISRDRSDEKKEYTG